jgi:hypothetical protein
MRAEAYGSHAVSLHHKVSLWLTPAALETSGHGRNVPGPNSQKVLDHQVSQWPTPNTPSGGPNPKSTATHTGGMDLDGAIQHWPTPDAGMRGGTNQSPSPGAAERPTLNTLATNWPTPRAEDSESAGNHPNATDSLTGATNAWRTPSSMDWKGESAQSWRDRDEGDPTPTLADQVYLHSLPAPSTSMDGQESSPSTQPSRRQLNPRFAAWLMGWPPGWTSLAPLNYESSETASSPNRPHGHFDACGPRQRSS